MINLFSKRKTHSAPSFERRGEAVENQLPKLDEYKGVDFKELLQGYPDSLAIGDGRLDALLVAIDHASIDRPQFPLSKKTVEELAGLESSRVIKIVAPEDPQEGVSFDEYSVSLPTKALVAAPGVVDWRLGRDETVFKSGYEMTSETRIKKNARLSPKTAPPVQHATVYLHPQGSAMWVLRGDGAHRACASVARGDEHILARDVRVVLLAEESSMA